MRIEIKIDEIELTHEPCKELYLYPGSTEKRIKLEIAGDDIVQGSIVVDINELKKALDKIAL